MMKIMCWSQVFLTKTPTNMCIGALPCAFVHYKISAAQSILRWLRNTWLQLLYFNPYSLMSYLLSVLVFLLIFSILILIHEFGHFFAARKAGVKIEEFGMGLPPRAKGFYKDRAGTLYSLNWIPFGGFVRMYGEDSEDKNLEHKEGSFSSKSIGKRTIIILGGVFMNFLLGYILLTVLFSVGTKPFIVSSDDLDYYRSQGIVTADDRVLLQGFLEGSKAKEVGLQEGDIIIEAEGKPILKSKDLKNIATAKKNGSLSLTVQRKEEKIRFHVPVDFEGKMGISIAEAPDVKEVKKVKFSVPEALYQAGYETVRLSWLTMKMFIQVLFDLFSKAELSPQVSGPVGIAQITHQTTQQGGFFEILKLIALLSISLGAINVLPIPALDGGRFLSIAFELVAGKRPNARWETRIHALGFVLLLFLILAVTYNDILRLIWGNS